MSQKNEKSLLEETLEKIASSYKLDTFVLTKKDERIQEILLIALAEKKAKEIIDQKKLERPKPTEESKNEENGNQELLEILTSDDPKKLIEKNKVGVKWTEKKLKTT